MLMVLSLVSAVSAICAIAVLASPSARKRFEGKTRLITWYVFLSLLVAFQLYAFNMATTNDPDAWWLQAATYSTYGVMIMAVIFAYLLGSLWKKNSQNST